MKLAVALLLLIQGFSGYALELSNGALAQRKCLEFYQSSSAEGILDSQNELRNVILGSLYEQSPRIADLISDPNNRFSNSEMAKAVSEKVSKKWLGFRVKNSMRGSVEKYGSKLVVTIGHLQANSDLKYGESPMGLSRSLINAIAGVIDGVLIRASKDKDIKSVKIIADSVVHPGLKQLLGTSGFEYYHSQAVFFVSNWKPGIVMGSSYGLEIKLR